VRSISWSSGPCCINDNNNIIWVQYSSACEIPRFNDHRVIHNQPGQTFSSAVMSSLSNVISALNSIPNMFATDFEKNFDPAVTVEFTANHWNVAIIAVVVYLSMVAFGPGIMSARKPFDLKYPLAAWNALLCAFSAVGMVRTVSYLRNG